MLRHARMMCVREQNSITYEKNSQISPPFSCIHKLFIRICCVYQILIYLSISSAKKYIVHKLLTSTYNKKNWRMKSKKSFIDFVDACGNESNKAAFWFQPCLSNEMKWRDFHYPDKFFFIFKLNEGAMKKFYSLVFLFAVRN